MRWILYITFGVGTAVLWGGSAPLSDSEIADLLEVKTARAPSGKLSEKATKAQVSDSFVGPIQPEDVRSFRKSMRENMLLSVDRAWENPERLIERDSPAMDYHINEKHHQVREKILPKLSFEQTPLSQVVGVLSTVLEEQLGENAINLVLIDPDRSDPLITITLRNLDIFRVLDYIVESIGFTYDVRRDALVVRPRIGPGYGLETEFFSVSRSTLIRLTGFHESKDLTPNPIPDPFALESEEQEMTEQRKVEWRLKDFLQRAGIPFAQIEGADLALADGQLIVTQTAENLVKIDNLLRRYNEIKQVEIEARFIEVQDRNLEELGFEWTLLAGGDLAYDSQGLPLLNSDGSQAKINVDRYSNGPIRTLGDTFASSQLDSPIIIDRPGHSLPDLYQRPPQIPSNRDLLSATSPLSSITGVINGEQIGLLIRALERQTGNDLLSAPKVTVLSGKTAEIVVAEEFRYPTSYGATEADVGRGDSTSGSAGVAITTGTPKDFTVRNIGVEMKVTPIVEENNAISLRLEPKVTELDGFVEYGGPSVAIASDTTVSVPSGFYQPIFSVRKVNTEVTIWDGATVIMGGLTREEVIQIEDKVPLLGNIPLVGKLFQSHSESSQKRNLLIFVTARLVSPGGSSSIQSIE